jgi:hypothetical protein
MFTSKDIAYPFAALSGAPFLYSKTLDFAGTAFVNYGVDFLITIGQYCNDGWLDKLEYLSLASLYSLV